LVEESAAAAESLKDQAHRMTTVVASNRLGGQSDVTSFAAAPPAHKPVAAKAIAKAAAYKPSAARAAKPAAPKAAPKAAPAPLAAAPAPAAASGASDDWESF
jgi:methyl-accepting chemotaxis protein